MPAEVTPQCRLSMRASGSSSSAACWGKANWAEGGERQWIACLDSFRGRPRESRDGRGVASEQSTRGEEEAEWRQRDPGPAALSGLSLPRPSARWPTCCRSRSPRSSLGRPFRRCRSGFTPSSLNRPEGIYTPGVARDHRYRVAMLPADFAGTRVLDVGRFDGFYAFLAERRGAERVLAVDNEQYRLWIASRWGIKLACGEGFRANHPLAGLGGRVSKDGRVRARRSRRAFAAAFFIACRTRWGCCVCCVDGPSAAVRC